MAGIMIPTVLKDMSVINTAFDLDLELQKDTKFFIKFTLRLISRFAIVCD